MVDRGQNHPALQRNRLTGWSMFLILAAPPISWIAQMTVTQLLSIKACSPLHDGVTRLQLPLLSVSALCLLAVIATGVYSWRVWRTTRHEQPAKSNNGARPTTPESEVAGIGEGRTRFVVLTALMECGLFIVAICITAVAVLGTRACFTQTTNANPDPSDLSRGNYIAKLGDCVSCHSAPGKHDFAGGFPLHAPVGIIYGTNITPDPIYGIGRYTRDDFRKAVRQGIAKGGKRLYPAMPYPSFNGMTDADVDALYDYFMHEVPPVAAPSPQTRLWFPLNQRWAIRLWNWLFLSDGRYVPRADRDAEWNRGAYLVETVAHCGACHTPRGLAYQERGSKLGDRHFLSGSDVDKWYSANLSGDADTGLGRWSQADIAQFLGTATANGSVAFGSMRQVINNSGRHMTDADRQAIARYLKSMPAHGDSARFDADVKTNQFERPGAGLYQQACSKCHQRQGEGIIGKYPRLAGNPIVLSPDPLSVIRLILEGGPHDTLTNNSQHMPSFAQFSDAELASVTSYIRSSWGNVATSVSTRKVAQIRRTLASLTQ